MSFSGGFAMLGANKPQVVVHEFSCDKCDYRSKQKADLKKHRQRVHRKKPHKSTKCDLWHPMFLTKAWELGLYYPETL